MELFKWSDEYSLGIQSIDSDHKSLFKIINELYDAMRQGKAAGMINEVVMRLHDYTKNHFRREEFYFKTTDYPDQAKHKKEHDTFIERVNFYQNELERGGSVTLDVVGFLREWLVKHIKGSDNAYQMHLKKYGIK